MRTFAFAPLLVIAFIGCEPSSRIDDVDELDPLGDPVETEDPLDDAPPQRPQLFGAPAATHPARSEAALASSVGPLGGMSPPRYVRHEPFEDAMLGIWPRPFSQVYAADAVPIPPWQSGHCPGVPDAR
jgi:hypothetical protein